MQLYIGPKEARSCMLIKRRVCDAKAVGVTFWFLCMHAMHIASCTGKLIDAVENTEIKL